MDKIRNFAIIAHIDHGKSTLADRMIDLSNNLSDREKKDRILDAMDLERERGITIKLNTASFMYKGYEFNLIDTPGHVDFSYEVSRSLSAADGVLLLVDASQGVQAQTIANLYLALNTDLTILPVVNKIDLPSADIIKCEEELIDLGFNKEDISYVSGKTGEGVASLLDKIIEKVPCPKGDPNKPLKALIFDSYYDPYEGVIASFRIFDGSLKVGDEIKTLGTKDVHQVVKLFKKNPKEVRLKEIKAGEVGYLAASIKNIKSILVGDTITLKNAETTPLPGFKEIEPMVYAGIFPINGQDFNLLRDALEKLKLNDASLSFEPETSAALGSGFRTGFLGLLHMDIINERLYREYNLECVLTSPSVLYKIYLKNGEVIETSSPAKFPDRIKIDYIEEPFVKAEIFTPEEYLGSIFKLCEEKRGIYKTIEYTINNQVEVFYELPLGEIIYDFFDKLKSITKGYATFSYELNEYKKSKLVKLDILINGEKADALSMIVHEDNVYDMGRKIVDKLKELIPRTLFEVPIQAVIDAKIIARSTVKALRKDVLAKCYGGDVSRKKKLLEKQKKGKKRMKTVGRVEVPADAFLEILKNNE